MPAYSSFEGTSGAARLAHVISNAYVWMFARGAFWVFFNRFPVQAQSSRLRVEGLHLKPPLVYNATARSHCSGGCPSLLWRSLRS